ncbi:hypothetical protein OHA59_45515 [Streptomyces sp. NBC_01589]|uniref:hypothetical protein n=1 Tax=Streptomyces sp. NBC_01589 TaxID=2975886 RepID=UPI00386345DB
MDRYRVTLSIGARIIMRGWWSDEAAAEGKYTRWIGERGGVDGAWITLTDEADGGRVLQSWPPENP